MPSFVALVRPDLPLPLTWPSSSSSSPPSCGPLVRVKPARARLARWEGRVMGFALPGDMPPGEVQLMLVDGDRRRLAHPDAYARDGQPVYSLPLRVRRRADRLLARHALDVFEHHNVACNGGRANLLNFVNGVAGYTGVTWFAVGTGPGTPTSIDQQLFTEFFRKQPSSFSVSGNQALVNTTFATTEANGTYTEAGIFGSAPVGASGGASGGNTASATANTGMLFAHSLYAFTKAPGVLLANNYYVQLS